MARDKNNGKPDVLTRIAVRVLTGKYGDVNSTTVDRELRDIADGTTPPPQGGAR